VSIWRGESPFVYLQGKIKVMKNIVKKYNNIVEFKAVVDTLIFTTMVYIAAMACKFIILNIA
jgi:hypothetical protein